MSRQVWVRYGNEILRMEWITREPTSRLDHALLHNLQSRYLWRTLQVLLWIPPVQ